MSLGPKSSWTGLMLGTAMGGLLMAATAASADVPKPSAAVQGDNAEANGLVGDAQAAMKSGNLRLALINLRKALQVAPSHSNARVQLGVALYQTGDPAGAERELRQALRAGAPQATVQPLLFKIMLARGEYQELVDQFADPGAAKDAAAPNLLKARAFALQRLGRGPEAVDAADRALKLQRDGESLLARANLALQQGDIAGAGKFADEALKASPNDAQIGLFKLGVLKAGKDGAGAMTYSNQLAAKFPANRDVQFAQIEMLLDQKQYPRASAQIDALQAKYPTALMPVYYQALLASQTGDAKAAFDTALTLPKEFVEVSSEVGLRIAQMAVDAGRKDAAADILGRVLGKDTGNLVVRRRLAAIYLDQGNAKSALTLLMPVENSSDPETVRLLSRVYTAMKRRDDAQAVLKRLGANRDHALLELRAGHTEQGIAELKDVAAKEPGNAAVAQPLITALLEARRFAEAMAVADRLAADPKQRATALVYRGNILLAQRNLTEAKAAFDKAVALEPNNVAVSLARADFLIASQKYAEAGKDLQAVVASDPKNAAARVKLAEISVRQGKEAEARKLLGEAIALAPRDTAPRLALARRLVAGRDFKGALKMADEIVRLQPANAEGVTLRGQIQALLDQKQEAVMSFRNLVSLAPNDAQAQLMLADALFETGDRAGTLAALDAAAEISPQSPAVAKAQSDLQFAFGNTDTALSKAQAFQASYPGREADLLLADALTKAKRFDQASDILSKSLAARPDKSVLSRLVAVKVAAKDRPAAKTAMTQWLARNPADLEVRHNLALFVLAEGDVAGARTQYEAILKQNANDVLAMNNLGGLVQAGDPARAASLFTKAVEVAPNSANVNDSLGWLKVQQKDAAGGLPYLQKAHNLAPQDASITYHLVVALDANGKRNDARALLKTLLASKTSFAEQQDAQRLAADWR